MNAGAAYDALEKFTREVVPSGNAQARLLSEILRLRFERPNAPPAKGLLHEIKQASDLTLYKQEHSDLIKTINFFWI